MDVDILGILGLAASVIVPIARGWYKSIPNRYIIGILLLFVANNLLFISDPVLRYLPLVLVVIYFALLELRPGDFCMVPKPADGTVIDHIFDVLDEEPIFGMRTLKVLTKAMSEQGHPIILQAEILLRVMIDRADHMIVNLGTLSENRQYYLGTVLVSIANLAVSIKSESGKTFVQVQTTMLLGPSASARDACKFLKDAAECASDIIKTGHSNLTLYP